MDVVILFIYIVNCYILNLSNYYFYLGKEKASKTSLILTRQESESDARIVSPGGSNLNLNQSIRERLRNRVRSSGSDVTKFDLSFTYN